MSSSSSTRSVAAERFWHEGHSQSLFLVAFAGSLLSSLVWHVDEIVVVATVTVMTMTQLAVTMILVVRLLLR